MKYNNTVVLITDEVLTSDSDINLAKANVADTKILKLNGFNGREDLLINMQHLVYIKTIKIEDEF